MRILYDHEFFSVFGYSGITRYFYEIMTRIAKMPGNRVSPFMGFHVNRYGLEKQRATFDKFFGIRRPHIPRTGRIFRAINGLGLSLFSRVSKSEIYHQSYYRFMLPGFKGKRIVTVHDMIYELFPQFFDLNEKAIQDKRHSVDKADGIIAVSESTKRDLMRLWNVPGEKIRVIYHGNSLTATPALKPPVEGAYLLYVGQRVPHKNFGMFFDAYCKTPWLNSAYKLVCFGGSPFTSVEMEAARKYGVQDRLTQLSGDDGILASLYQNAATLVYPSFYEGFGLPILEAMSNGCPVVLSRTSSLVEVGREGGAFFDPYDQEDLLKQLKIVLNDEGVRQEMREKGYRHAATFTWEKCARETEDFYREILSR